MAHLIVINVNGEKNYLSQMNNMTTDRRQAAKYMSQKDAAKMAHTIGDHLKKTVSGGRIEISLETA